MADIGKTSSLLASAIETRTNQADGIAALAREAGGNPPKTVDFGGVKIVADRVAVASGARFSQQITELRQAAANASNAASLLDSADVGLSQIKDKLTRMDELAKTAALTPVERDDGSTYTPSELSAQERATLNEEFDDLRAEINSVASSTSFNGTNLLAGDPDGSGDPLEISVQTGGAPPKTVSCSLAASDAEALSSDLATADLISEANADVAVAAVDEALDAVADRQAAVRGARAQLNSVETAAGEVSAVVDDSRAARVTPEKAIDLSRVVADHVKEDSAIEFSEGATKLLQDMLLRLSAATANGGPPTGGDAAEEFGGKTSGAPAPATASAPTSETASTAS